PSGPSLSLAREDAQFAYWYAKLPTGTTHSERGYRGVVRFGHFAGLTAVLESEQPLVIREQNNLLRRSLPASQHGRACLLTKHAARLGAQFFLVADIGNGGYPTVKNRRRMAATCSNSFGTFR